MEYIIISLLTISIFTYIVYLVANRILATKMHIKFLILCACCSLLISCILPRIFVGFAGLTGTLSIVLIFAIISSYCIAYYYDDTIKKVALQNALATNSIEVPEILQADTAEVIQLMVNLNETWARPSPQMQDEECSTANEGIEQSNHIITEATCACFLKNIVEMTENTKATAEFVDKQYFYPVKYEERNRNIVTVKNNNIIQQNNLGIPLDNAVEIDQKAKVLKSKMDFKNKINILNTPLMIKTIHKHLDSPISNELANSYPSSNDLDSLMDFAFLQKEQRNFPQALTFFRQALRLYADSEVGPFLVMEVGTILKILGSYDEALKVFTDGRLLPGVINNSMLEQEFINNIAYLRIVKNILIQNSLEFMPFNCIPANAFNEIDAAFYEWRNQS